MARWPRSTGACCNWRNWRPGAILRLDFTSFSRDAWTGCWPGFTAAASGDLSDDFASRSTPPRPGPPRLDQGFPSFFGKDFQIYACFLQGFKNFSLAVSWDFNRLRARKKLFWADGRFANLFASRRLYKLQRFVLS